MKHLLFLLALLCLTACETVIDVELDETEPREVIEATLNGETGVLSVRITTTGPYFEAGSVLPVGDATVELRNDQTAEVLQIAENSTGTFVATLNATPGTEYTLRVQTPENEYIARSRLPAPVDIAEISSEFQEARGPQEEGYRLEFRFQDPPGEQNFYRLVHSVNGIPQREGDDLLVTEDILFDGGFARVQLFQQTFELADTVRLELWHIDAAGYEYYNSLADILVTDGNRPNSGSAAPGNPTSNWSNDALGYFSAYYPTQREIVVEE